MNVKRAASKRRTKLAAWVGAVLLAGLGAPQLHAAQINLVGPPGSVAFGTTVTILPNGNIVVTDPDFQSGPQRIGAVHLYDANTLALISTLTGSSAFDNVGSGGITVVGGGHFVVSSPDWDNAALGHVNAGAVTWVNGTSGLNAAVSSSNSLVGVTSNNLVGGTGVIPLANGNYVVSSPFWEAPGFPPDAGAVTFCNGASGRTGFVTAANSLTGSSTNDRVGNVTALPNGNYVVWSTLWDNPAAGVVNAGSLTWASGLTGIAGAVSTNNSLVGTSASDFDNITVTPLTNGNFVVGLLYWNSVTPPVVDAGAALLVSGTTGRVGVISSAIALIGSNTNDRVGYGVLALSNGNYVVASPNWDKPGLTNVGAVTLCNGVTGRVGFVSASNSLTGNTFNDQVGFGAPGLTALSNGDFIVASQLWNNPSPLIPFVGAVTLCSGATGRPGQIVSAANSVVGSSTNDFLCRVRALANGNYVVSSRDWDNPSPYRRDVGVAALCSGLTGRTGTLSAANALVGSAVDDKLSDGGVLALANGNYVVLTPLWDNPVAGVTNAGAATWCNGFTGRIGSPDSTNSLLGSSRDDRIGLVSEALENGNYVVGSGNWSNLVAYNAGAATWGNGATGRFGFVNASNSLVGTNNNDAVADDTIAALSDGNYVVISTGWSGGKGAVTLGNGSTGTTGPITVSNSVLAGVSAAFDSFDRFYDYDAVRKRLAVGLKKQNIVTLLTPDELPALWIERSGSGPLTISWAPPVPGWTLQQAAALSPHNWTNAPTGSTNPAVISADAPIRIFRLLSN